MTGHIILAMNARRIEDFSEKLLEAGVTLFAEKGFHGTGVKDIVERAGVPKGSFYNYFDSKEAFGAAILRHYADSQAANSSIAAKITAAEAIKALKIHFYAIGAGINGIAPAPIYTPRGPMTDALGNIFYQNQRVEFNEAGLKEVARIADGLFFRATDTRSLEQIYHEVDKLEKSTVAVKKYQEYRDLFPFCVMSGCGLLIAQLLLSQTVWKKLP